MVAVLLVIAFVFALASIGWLVQMVNKEEDVMESLKNFSLSIVLTAVFLIIAIHVSSGEDEYDYKGGSSKDDAKWMAVHITEQEAIGYEIDYFATSHRLDVELVDDYLYIVEGPIKRDFDGRYYDLWAQIEKTEDDYFKIIKLRIDGQDVYYRY